VAEAVQRPSTRCVPIKTDDQLDLQALHRVRSRLIGDRTAVINQLRGFLLEHGLPVRQGHRFLRQQLPQILATRTDVLSPRMVRIIGATGDRTILGRITKRGNRYLRSRHFEASLRGAAFLIKVVRHFPTTCHGYR
jgi:transposase